MHLMLTTNLKAYKVTGKQKKYCMWTFKNTNLTTMAQLTLTDNTAMFWSYIKKMLHSYLLHCWNKFSISIIQRISNTLKGCVVKERYTDFSVTDRDLQSMSLPSKEMQPGKFIAVQTRLLNVSSVAVQLLVMKMCRS